MWSMRQSQSFISFLREVLLVLQRNKGDGGSENEGTEPNIDEKTNVEEEREIREREELGC